MINTQRQTDTQAHIYSQILQLGNRQQEAMERILQENGMIRFATFGLLNKVRASISNLIHLLCSLLSMYFVHSSQYALLSLPMGFCI